MAIFLVGSGPSEQLDDVYDLFVAAVGAHGKRVAIALLGNQTEAAKYLDQYAAPLLERNEELLIEPIWLSEDQTETDWPSEPTQLAGLVVGGGWAPGYLDALAPQQRLITKLVRAGVPYLGYSAGAQIAAKHAIVGGWQYRGHQIAPEIVGEGTSELVLGDGLGLIGITVEIHGDTRTTWGRAIAALQAGPATSALAIDDDTCLVIDAVSGQTQVVGAGRVSWMTRHGEQIVLRVEYGIGEKN